MINFTFSYRYQKIENQKRKIRGSHRKHEKKTYCRMQISLLYCLLSSRLQTAGIPSHFPIILNYPPVPSVRTWLSRLPARPRLGRKNSFSPRDIDPGLGQAQPSLAQPSTALASLSTSPHTETKNNLRITLLLLNITAHSTSNNISNLSRHNYVWEEIYSSELNFSTSVYC